MTTKTILIVGLAAAAGWYFFLRRPPPSWNTDGQGSVDMAGINRLTSFANIKRGNAGTLHYGGV